MKSINKEPIKIENDSVIYMGVVYNKKQWEAKLKENKKD